MVFHHNRKSIDDEVCGDWVARLEDLYESAHHLALRERIRLLQLVAAPILDHNETNTEVTADLALTLGTAFYHFGKYDRAEPLIRRALGFVEQAPSVASSSLIFHIKTMLGIIASRQGKFTQAEALFDTPSESDDVEKFSNLVNRGMAASR